ncbi:hypothetical protein H696_03694 [Fonticula alba]|uniref:Proteasome assembly chaperone 2 n=1 Tax=Fonticula alba TaxID=691883 RepID=A0A058Z6V1_FONAL|nr:hypothetical protein H696_03694 [Fonticula alba]KCV69267.1 hypothetical protein H696_03694 [Fonticula alba]|eukprot:XP_009495832.1 hypothetical protein H696_03694 [Fonticula alba]
MSASNSDPLFHPDKSCTRPGTPFAGTTLVLTFDGSCTILQQRSPAVEGCDAHWARELFDWILRAGFSDVWLLTGLDSAVRVDTDLLTDAKIYFSATPLWMARMAENPHLSLLASSWKPTGMLVATPPTPEQLDQARAGALAEASALCQAESAASASSPAPATVGSPSAGSHTGGTTPTGTSVLSKMLSLSAAYSGISPVFFGLDATAGRGPTTSADRELLEQDAKLPTGSGFSQYILQRAALLSAHAASSGPEGTSSIASDEAKGGAATSVVTPPAVVALARFTADGDNKSDAYIVATAVHAALFAAPDAAKRNVGPGGGFVETSLAWPQPFSWRQLYGSPLPDALFT